MLWLDSRFFAVYFFLCKKNGKPKKKKVLIQHNPVFTLEWGSKQKTRVAASDIKLITGAQLSGNHAEGISIYSLNL